MSITERRATDAATMVEAYTAAAMRGECLSTANLRKSQYPIDAARLRN